MLSFIEKPHAKMMAGMESRLLLVAGFNCSDRTILLKYVVIYVQIQCIDRQRDTCTVQIGTSAVNWHPAVHNQCFICEGK